MTSDKNKAFRELTKHTSFFHFYRRCVTNELVKVCLQTNNKVEFSQQASVQQ
jgi:hypothetical protein